MRIELDKARLRAADETINYCAEVSASMLTYPEDHEYDPEARSFLRGMLSLAKALGWTDISEGDDWEEISALARASVKLRARLDEPVWPRLAAIAGKDKRVYLAVRDIDGYGEDS